MVSTFRDAIRSLSNARLILPGSGSGLAIAHCRSEPAATCDQLPNHHVGLQDLTPAAPPPHRATDTESSLASRLQPRESVRPGRERRVLAHKLTTLIDGDDTIRDVIGTVVEQEYLVDNGNGCA